MPLTVLTTPRWGPFWAPGGGHGPYGPPTVTSRLSHWKNGPPAISMTICVQCMKNHSNKWRYRSRFWATGLLKSKFLHVTRGHKGSTTWPQLTPRWPYGVNIRYQVNAMWYDLGYVFRLTQSGRHRNPIKCTKKVASERKLNALQGTGLRIWMGPLVFPLFWNEIEKNVKFLQNFNIFLL